MAEAKYTPRLKRDYEERIVPAMTEKFTEERKRRGRVSACTRARSSRRLRRGGRWGVRVPWMVRLPSARVPRPGPTTVKRTFA